MKRRLLRFAFGLAVASMSGCKPSSPTAAPTDEMSTETADAAVSEGTSDIDETERVFFVGPSGESSGNGRRHTPFTTVQRAYSVARSGDVIHLLPGAHSNVTCPPSGVRLQGSGPDVTEINGTLVIDVSDTQISEVSIVGQNPSLHILQSARIDNAVVHSSAGVGILVDATAQLRNVSIQRTGLDGTTPTFTGVSPSGPAAVLVEANGRLDWARGTIGETAWSAVHVVGDARIDQVDIVDAGGVGLAILGGKASVTDSRIAQTTGVGILVVDGRLELDRSDITSVRPTESVALRAGIAAYGGVVSVRNSNFTNLERALRLARKANATVSNIQVGNVDVDAIAMDDSTANIRRAVISSAGNTGVSAVSNSAITGSELTVGTAGRAAILISESHFELSDVTVNRSGSRGIAILRSGGWLRGMSLRNIPDVAIQVTDPSAEVTLADGHIIEAGTSGVSTNGPTAKVNIENVIIEGIKRGEGGLGEGIHAYNSHVHLSGVTARENDGSGLLLEQSKVTGEEVLLTSNLSPGAVLINVSADSNLVALQAQNNSGYGVLVLESSITLINPLITNTQFEPSAGPGEGLSIALDSLVTIRGTDAAAHLNGSHGVAIQGNSHLSVERLSVESNGGYGLYAACGQSTVEVGGQINSSGNQLGPEMPCP